MNRWAKDMTEPSTPFKPPTQASPARRVLHAVIALVGWAVFVYWWWVVFHRVSRHDVQFTVLFVAVALLAIVTITGVWAWHNARIFKRRGARRHVRDVTPDFSRDVVGRAVMLTGAETDRRAAPVVYIRFTAFGKTYQTASGLKPPDVKVHGATPITTERPRGTARSHRVTETP